MLAEGGGWIEVKVVRRQARMQRRRRNDARMRFPSFHSGVPFFSSIKFDPIQDSVRRCLGRHERSMAWCMA